MEINYCTSSSEDQKNTSLTIILIFLKKSELYFQAVEITDENKRWFALLFNLNEDALRLAESVEFTEGANAYKN